MCVPELSPSKTRWHHIGYFSIFQSNLLISKHSKLESSVPVQLMALHSTTHWEFHPINWIVIMMTWRYSSQQAAPLFTAVVELSFSCSRPDEYFVYNSQLTRHFFVRSITEAIRGVTKNHFPLDNWISSFSSIAPTNLSGDFKLHRDHDLDPLAFYLTRHADHPSTRSISFAHGMTLPKKRFGGRPIGGTCHMIKFLPSGRWLWI